ncbi:MAG: ATP-binding cassette domain-containing protein [Magnetococcales bacterium]|nr:ATP-binding cassette domain-containing protein [Magnetococcales bacterium]
MLLTVRHLTMRFGGLTALHNVGFEVKTGSITALIGPNGAGKTTVFNCITGFYRATAGSLHLRQPDGEEVDLAQLLGQPWRPSDLRHPGRLGGKLFYKMFGGSHRIALAGVARTFQNIRLFRDMTVLENLLVAQHRLVNRNLWSGLLRTSLFREHEEMAVEQGAYWLGYFDLTREANRPAGELPYGHQRRLEMARAMCTNPLLLCLDEPAAGLNPGETRELAARIGKLRDEHGVTILLIEHDMGLVMGLSDHVVVLDHGEVIASGPPALVQRDERVKKAYLGVAEEDEDGELEP